MEDGAPLMSSIIKATDCIALTLASTMRNFRPTVTHLLRNYRKQKSDKQSNKQINKQTETPTKNANKTKMIFLRDICRKKNL